MLNQKGAVWHAQGRGGASPIEALCAEGLGATGRAFESPSGFLAILRVAFSPPAQRAGPLHAERE